MLVAAVCISHVAQASAASGRGRANRGPRAELSAAFQPKRLGAATTITFAVRINQPVASAPAPLARVVVSYPTELGLATSGLGLQSCAVAALELEGPSACPPDSAMGQGAAVVEIPFGSDIVKERVALGIYAAPSSDGYLHLSIVAFGVTPVLAQVVLAGVLLPGRLKITVPPIISLPEAPYVSLVSMRASLGGALTYYEHAHGRTIAYRPKGIGLPETCPQGGWKLGAYLAFIDGRSSHAGTVIPCPYRA